MGRDGSRILGPVYSQTRTEDSVLISSSIGSPTPAGRFASVTREEAGVARRDHSHASEEGARDSTFPRGSGILLPPLRGDKAVRWLETSDRPQGPQPAHHLPPLQDGDRALHQGAADSWAVGSHSRPVRRLLPSVGSPEVQEVFENLFRE